MKRINKNMRHGLFRTIKVIPPRLFLQPERLSEETEGWACGAKGEGDFFFSWTLPF